LHKSLEADKNAYSILLRNLETKNQLEHIDIDNIKMDFKEIRREVVELINFSWDRENIWLVLTSTPCKESRVIREEWKV
jgi:hypothetical protein